jgi:hypothetical protein
MIVRRQIRIATALKQASFYEGYCSTRRHRVLILRKQNIRSTRLPARDRIHISTSHRFFDQNNTIGF